MTTPHPPMPLFFTVNVLPAPIRPATATNHHKQSHPTKPADTSLISYDRDAFASIARSCWEVEFGQAGIVSGIDSIKRFMERGRLIPLYL